MPATAPRHLIARYPGTCPACGHTFNAGEYIVKAPGEKATHRLCTIPAGRIIQTCACGSALSASGYCIDEAMFGSHKSAS